MKTEIQRLPIYEEPDEIYRYEYVMKEPSKLELGIQEARATTEDFLSKHKETFDRAAHIYETGKAHSKEAVYYILDEDNIAARAGLITLGGVIGLLKARRSGFLKRLTYFSLGASVCAGALYPKDAYNIGVGEGVRLKKLALIAYNFALGAKPEEKSKPVETPVKTFDQDVEQAAPVSLAVAAEDTTAASDTTTAAVVGTAGPAADLTAPEAEQVVETQTENQEDLNTEKVVEAVAAEVQEAASIAATVAAEVVEVVIDELASKDKVVGVSETPKVVVEGDLGQGNPEDSELYTTRQ